MAFHGFGSWRNGRWLVLNLGFCFFHCCLGPCWRFWLFLLDNWRFFVVDLLSTFFYISSHSFALGIPLHFQSLSITHHYCLFGLLNHHGFVRYNDRCSVILINFWGLFWSIYALVNIIDILLYISSDSLNCVQLFWLASLWPLLFKLLKLLIRFLLLVLLLFFKTILFDLFKLLLSFQASFFLDLVTALLIFLLVLLPFDTLLIHSFFAADVIFTLLSVN